MSKMWAGDDFITQDGGNLILQNALNHYKERLMNITSDYSVKKLGSSIVGLLDKEAQKTLKPVDEIIQILSTNDLNKIDTLKFRIPVLEKALNCYSSDILKVDGIMKKDYSDVFGAPRDLKKELPKIQEALKKINEYY